MNQSNEVDSREYANVNFVLFYDIILISNYFYFICSIVVFI